jgi:hypothetical protein
MNLNGGDLLGGRFHHCASIIECTYTNLDSVGQSLDVGSQWNQDT